MKVLITLITSLCIEMVTSARTLPSSVHLWDGSEGVAEYQKAVHDAIPSGTRTDVASLLPTKTWFGNMACVKCPEHIIVRLDIDPKIIANEILSEFHDRGLNSMIDLPRMIDMIEDAQLHHYLTAVGVLQEYLKSQGYPNWEGGTTAFLGKLRMMRELMFKPGMDTVCEIGFNNGASTLMWLISGAKKVLSFDIGIHGYTSHAVDWLSQRFPGRFQVIMGDSQYTVSSFHQMFPNEKCDLIFVDGGHMYENAIKDLMNFKPMIRGPNHILLMDDISEPEVARAWYEMIDGGHVVEEVRVFSPYSEGFQSPFSQSLEFIGGRLSEDPQSIQSKYAGEMSYGRYTS
jgi:hypothetical protein